MQASVIRMRFVPPSFQESASILVGVKVVQTPPSSGLNDALALLRHKPVPASFICTSFHLQGLEKFNLQELSIRCMDILHGTVRPRELTRLPTVSSHCIGNSHNPHAIHKTTIPSCCIHQLTIPPPATSCVCTHPKCPLSLVLTRTHFVSSSSLPPAMVSVWPHVRLEMRTRSGMREQSRAISEY
jgi:hypothetical protein